MGDAKQRGAAGWDRVRVLRGGIAAGGCSRGWHVRGQEGGRPRAYYGGYRRNEAEPVSLQLHIHSTEVCLQNMATTHDSGQEPAHFPRRPESVFVCFEGQVASALGAEKQPMMRWPCQLYFIYRRRRRHCRLGFRQW